MRRWMYTPWRFTLGVRLVFLASGIVAIVMPDLNVLQWLLGAINTVAFAACVCIVWLIAVELADVAHRSRVVVPRALSPRGAFWLTLLGVVTCGATSLYAATRLWRGTVSLLGVIGPARSRQVSRLWALAIFFPEWILQKEMVAIDDAIRAGHGRIREPVRDTE